METRKEFRFLEQPELRASAGNILEGHAAVFNQWSRNLGGFREKILPGAFARSILQDNVIALWAHDQQSIPLARNKSGSLELSEDSIGLRSVIHLPDTSFAKDLYTSVKRGDIASMSFAFLTKKDSWSAGGSERTLHEAQLVDVSVVNVGAYEAASVSARSLGPGISSDDEILTYEGITPAPVSDEEKMRLQLRLDLLRRL